HPPRSTLFPYTTLFRSEKTSSHLQREATVLHSILQGWGVTVHSASKKKLPTITLQIDKGLGVREEGYVLDINQQGITVKSPSARSEEHTSELQSRENLV